VDYYIFAPDDKNMKDLFAIPLWMLWTILDYRTCKEKSGSTSTATSADWKLSSGESKWRSTCSSSEAMNRGISVVTVNP